MPTLTEHLDSRRTEQDGDGNLTSATLQFTLLGVSDDATARATAISGISQTFNNLVRDSVELSPRWVDDNSSRGEWEVEATYVTREEAEPKTTEQEITIDVGAASQRITQSLATIDSFAPPNETAPDYEGAINVSDDRVEGVDIEFPVVTITVTRYVPDADVTQSYLNTLYGLSQTVNDSSITLRRKRFDADNNLVTRDMVQFDAGELKFDGFTQSYREEKNDWQFTYTFSASPNETGLVIGSISGITKRGWDYMWVKYKQTTDANAGALVKVPVAVYVEQVYKDGDFTLI